MEVSILKICREEKEREKRREREEGRDVVFFLY